MNDGDGGGRLDWIGVGCQLGWDFGVWGNNGGGIRILLWRS